MGAVTGFAMNGRLRAVSTLFADMTLDELRPVLARELPRHAGFDGWNDRAVESAAMVLGVKPEVAALVFENRVEMIDAWFAAVDAEMLGRLPAETLAAMKIRERITALVEARIAILAPDKEALRRALAILAFPGNAPRAVQLGWRAADVMWRAAGDTATDYNHYTKRAILGSVYAATMAVFLGDESDGWAETRAFLARRIEGVMQFEKAKAQWLQRPAVGFSPSRFFGRLRYPG
jgi:ubiquinone biosynthesis protein COQ9